MSNINSQLDSNWSILDNSLLLAQEKLGLFAISADLEREIRLAFGNDVNVVEATSLIQELTEPNPSGLPKFEIRSQSEIAGANGAFSGSNYTIYLSGFLGQNRNNSGAIITVVLEESGHSVEWNLSPDSDTPGDEGELFSALVEGVALSESELQRIKTEDDRVAVTLDGQRLTLEQAATTFVSLENPVGIAIDGQGNLIVNHDNIVSLLISKIAPDRTLLQQIEYGDFTSITDLGYFATIPSGGIVQLQSDGDLVFVDSNNLSLNPLLNLKALAVNTDSIFNILTGTTENLGGLIQPGAAQTVYGDIAILERGNQLDVFIAGKSVGVFPFIMRLRLNTESGSLDARVVAASTGSTAGSVNLTRGVAVNTQGTVLTTLAVNIGQFGFIDVPVSFGVDFPEGVGSTPAIRLRGTVPGADYVDIASQGITTDVAGNFYVATNSVGSAALQTAGASLIVLSPSVSNVLDVQGSFGSSYRDVAVNSDSTLAYVTTPNSVLSFTIDNLTPPPTGDPLTSPIYRFYNPISQGHFFTSSPTERDSVIANPNLGYRDEGIGFSASQSPGTDLLPVYRFYNSTSQGHFFTTNLNERDSVIANPNLGYRDEGIGFYAYGSSASLGSDVYRFYNPVSRGHFFTISEVERDNVIANLQQYAFEGAGFEARS